MSDYQVKGNPAKIENFQLRGQVLALLAKHARAGSRAYGGSPLLATASPRLRPLRRLGPGLPMGALPPR